MKKIKDDLSTKQSKKRLELYLRLEAIRSRLERAKLPEIYGRMSSTVVNDDLNRSEAGWGDFDSFSDGWDRG